jgi:hypothetical protein
MPWVCGDDDAIAAPPPPLATASGLGAAVAPAVMSAASHEILPSALAIDPFARSTFGEVFRARWNVSTPVAAKVCLLASAEALRDFAREAATLAPLQHPHILRLWGVPRRRAPPRESSFFHVSPSCSKARTHRRCVACACTPLRKV